MDRVAVDLRVAFHSKRGIPRYVWNFVWVLPKIELKDIEIFLLLPSHHKTDSPCLPPLPDNIRLAYLEERSVWHWEQILIPKWCRKNGVRLAHLFTNRGPVFNRGIHDVHVVHDTIAIHRANWEYGFLRGVVGLLYNRTAIRLSAKTAQYIITVSNFSRQEIVKELKVPPEKISVVYIGAESIFFNPPELDLKELSLPDKPFLFHLGSFDPRKNTERVIQAYAALPPSLRLDFPLVIAGLSQKAREKFLPLINSLGIVKEILLLPFITDEELAALYKACFAFIWPSLWEGFGLPVLEAMAANAAVLTSNTTSLLEIAGGNALLVDPTNIEEIKNGIAHLIDDHSLRGKLKEKGQAWAKNFTWENTVRETVNIWKKVLSN